MNACCDHGSASAVFSCLSSHCIRDQTARLPRRCVLLHWALAIAHFVNSNQRPGMPSHLIRKWHHPCPVNQADAHLPLPWSVPQGTSGSGTHTCTWGSCWLLGRCAPSQSTARSRACLSRQVFTSWVQVRPVRPLLPACFGDNSSNNSRKQKPKTQTVGDSDMAAILYAPHVFPPGGLDLSTGTSKVPDL